MEEETKKEMKSSDMKFHIEIDKIFKNYTDEYIASRKSDDCLDLLYDVIASTGAFYENLIASYCKACEMSQDRAELKINELLSIMKRHILTRFSELQ